MTGPRPLSRALKGATHTGTTGNIWSDIGAGVSGLAAEAKADRQAREAAALQAALQAAKDERADSALAEDKRRDERDYKLRSGDIEADNERLRLTSQQVDLDRDEARRLREEAQTSLEEYRDDNLDLRARLGQDNSNRGWAGLDQRQRIADLKRKYPGHIAHVTPEGELIFVPKPSLPGLGDSPGRAPSGSPVPISTSDSDLQNSDLQAFDTNEAPTVDPTKPQPSKPQTPAATTTTPPAPSGRVTEADGTVRTGHLGIHAKAPVAVQTGYVENKSNLDKLKAALKAAETEPDAFGLKNLLPEIATQRFWPEGVPERARVADIGSLKIHQRSGAAVTAKEFPRLRPFIPSAHDTGEAVAEKLRLFIEEVERIQQDIESAYPNDPRTGTTVTSALDSPKSPKSWRMPDGTTVELE